MSSDLHVVGFRTHRTSRRRWLTNSGSSLGQGTEQVGKLWVDPWRGHIFKTGGGRTRGGGKGRGWGEEERSGKAGCLLPISHLHFAGGKTRAKTRKWFVLCHCACRGEAEISNPSLFGSSPHTLVSAETPGGKPHPQVQSQQIPKLGWEGGAGEDAAKRTCKRKAVENVW